MKFIVAVTMTMCCVGVISSVQPPQPRAPPLLQRRPPGPSGIPPLRPAAPRPPAFMRECAPPFCFDIFVNTVFANDPPPGIDLTLVSTSKDSHSTAIGMLKEMLKIYVQTK